jgi:hypothetical protein
MFTVLTINKILMFVSPKANWHPRGPNLLDPTSHVPLYLLDEETAKVYGTNCYAPVEQKDHSVMDNLTYYLTKMHEPDV